MLDLGKTFKVLMAVVGIIQVVPYSTQQELLVYFPTELLNIITSHSAKLQ